MNNRKPILPYPTVFQGKGPHEVQMMMKDGSAVSVLGERLKCIAVLEFPGEAFRVSVRGPEFEPFDSMGLRLIREVVAFEHPMQTEVTSRIAESDSVPLTWWDHLRYSLRAHSWARILGKPRMRHITTVFNTYVEKHYHTYPVGHA